MHSCAAVKPAQRCAKRNFRPARTPNFEDRGAQEIKGVRESARVYAVRAAGMIAQAPDRSIASIGCLTVMFVYPVVAALRARAPHCLCRAQRSTFLGFTR
jgi:hypothetical protein